VVLFLSRYVLPQFADLYRQFHIQIPVVTLTLLEVGNILPMLLVVIGIAIVAWWLLWRFVRRRDGGMGEATLISLPLVGPVVRRGRIARWCDAMKLSVDAGLDLPAAANLAADAIQSRGLRHDGLALIEWLHNAPDAHEPPADLRILPATVPASMGLALQDNQMSQVLGTLSQMYAQQAEQRMFIIPAVLGPILLVLVTIVLGLVLLALFLPMVSLIRAIGV
jgi:type II secretory pathway component PulF